MAFSWIVFHLKLDLFVFLFWYKISEAGPFNRCFVGINGEYHHAKLSNVFPVFSV